MSRIESCPICGANIQTTCEVYTTGATIDSDGNVLDDGDTRQQAHGSQTRVYCLNDHTMEEMINYVTSPEKRLRAILTEWHDELDDYSQYADRLANQLLIEIAGAGLEVVERNNSRAGVQIYLLTSVQQEILKRKQLDEMIDWLKWNDPNGDFDEFDEDMAHDVMKGMVDDQIPNPQEKLDRFNAFINSRKWCEHLAEACADVSHGTSGYVYLGQYWIELRESGDPEFWTMYANHQTSGTLPECQTWLFNQLLDAIGEEGIDEALAVK
ncbi:MAG TPA: hypothetical protein DCE55_29415 [Planctomycetaceae bacterium]|nr:hypothetical protein [Planctomycetaceae bacterium]|tara:strand:- start:1187 stop:1990 length:804 start_codon:yes stop_codon:yes gene_type:complete